jgi:uncharacterized membrane protein YfcA
MEVPKLFILILTGVAAGFINVMAGGGSLLTMPVMKLLLGLDGPAVNGSNRVAIGAGAVTAVLRFFKQGYADFKLSLSLAACALPGALAGALAGTRLRGLWFNRTLALVMIAVLVLMSLKKKNAHAAASRPCTRGRMLLGHLLMVGVGFYGGFIQAGVGFLLMAVLHRVMGLDLVRVNMHKVFIVMVYTALAIGIFAWHGNVLWLPGLCLACGNSAGAWIGTHYAVKKGEKLIRCVFQLAVVGLALKLLIP